jgi:hypothetical protein
MLSFVMLSVIMLSVILLSVIMLSALMLIVVAQRNRLNDWTRLDLFIAKKKVL